MIVVQYRAATAGIVRAREAKDQTGVPGYK